MNMAKCGMCRFLKKYEEGHKYYGQYYCGHAGAEDSEPITEEESKLDIGWCEANEVMEKPWMIDSGRTIVATVHTSRERDSRYIKVSINDNLEQVSGFVASVLNCDSFRLYDESQDTTLLEYVQGEFRFDRKIESEANQLINELSLIRHNLRPAPVVRIQNFWMDERYNNLSEMLKVIKKNQLRIKVDMWMGGGLDDN